MSLNTRAGGGGGLGLCAWLCENPVGVVGWLPGRRSASAPWGPGPGGAGGPSPDPAVGRGRPRCRRRPRRERGGGG